MPLLGVRAGPSFCPGPQEELMSKEMEWVRLPEEIRGANKGIFLPASGCWWGLHLIDGGST